MKKKPFLLRTIALLTLVGGLIWGYARQAQNTAPPDEQTGVAAEQNTGEDKNDDKSDDRGTPTGDDPFTELGQLVNTYYKGDQISLKGTVRLIDDNYEEDKLIGEYPFSYQYNAGDFYYSLDSMEFISQQEKLLAVDHRGKSITLSSAGGMKNIPGLFNIGDFRKLVEAQKASAEVTQSGNLKMLTLENIQDPQIQGYRIYYDPSTYAITKILIGMVRPGPLEETENEKKDNTANEMGDIYAYSYYMEINYNSREVLGRKTAFNPLARFIFSQGNAFNLQPAYTTYELHDLSSESANLNQEPSVSE